MRTTMPLIKCSECVFAVKKERGMAAWVECHGRMPTADTDEEAVWPAIDIDEDGCGEGERREQEEESDV